MKDWIELMHFFINAAFLIPPTFKFLPGDIKTFMHIYQIIDLGKAELLFLALCVQNRLEWNGSYFNLVETFQNNHCSQTVDRFDNHIYL